MKNLDLKIEKWKPSIDRVDILHDECGNILIKNGDFKIGASDEQHIADIFILHQGEIKEFPLCGFGAMQYVKTNITKVEFKRNLKLQLEYDGYVDN